LQEIVARRAFDLQIEEYELKPTEMFDLFAGTGVSGQVSIIVLTLVAELIGHSDSLLS
jgi:hypothetical protein